MTQTDDGTVMPDPLTPSAAGLVLTAADADLAAAVLAALSGPATAPDTAPLAAEVVTLAEAEAVLQSGTAPHLVLVFRGAAQAVARALVAGVAPESALATWLAGAEELLLLSRRHRRHSSVLEATAALALPVPAMAALASRSGVRLPAPSLAATRVDPAPPSPLFWLTARLVLSQSERAQAVQTELDALALPLGIAEPDLGAVLQTCLADAAQGGRDLATARHQAATAADELMAATAERDRHFQEMGRLTLELQSRDDEFARREADWRVDKDKERRLLLEQMFDLESRCESDFKALRTAEDKLAAMQDGAADLSRQVADLERSRAALDQEILTGRGHIATLEAALDDAQTRIEAAEADRALLNSELDQAGAVHQQDRAHLLSEVDRIRAELDRVYNSRSWKVTAPLRGLRRTLSTVSNG